MVFLVTHSTLSLASSLEPVGRDKSQVFHAFRAVQLELDSDRLVNSPRPRFTDHRELIRVVQSVCCDRRPYTRQQGLSYICSHSKGAA